jgi:hypothetical protein
VCKDDRRCVECVVHDDCPLTTPVCKGDLCVECAKNDDCADPERPICKAEECVQCDKDEHCAAPTPRCENQVCVAD